MFWNLSLSILELKHLKIFDFPPRFDVTRSKASDALTSQIAKKFIVEFHPLSRVGDPPIEP